MKKLLVITTAVAVTLGCMCQAKVYRESTDKYIRDRVVMLTGNKMQCSGIQIKVPSGKVYILTASHCSALLDNLRQVKAIDEQGNNRQVNLVAIDSDSDLMLLTSMNNLYIKVADKTYFHEKIRTLTHGASHATYTTYGELMEEQELVAPLFPILTPEDINKCPKDHIHSVQLVDGFFVPIRMCVVSAHETMSNAMTVPGSSGGAVVDNSGSLVGIESMGIGEFSGFVRFNDIKNFLKDY